jgi:hypothetical protein
MEVFLVAYICFNLNLESFAEIWPQTGNSAKAKRTYTCSEVKTIFAVKFLGPNIIKI